LSSSNEEVQSLRQKPIKCVHESARVIFQVRLGELQSFFPLAYSDQLPGEWENPILLTLS